MDKSKILGLRTTIYKVGDLENAKNWYTNIFKTEPYFDQPFYVGFNIGGYELGLQPEETPSTDKTESVVKYWGVEDIQSVYNNFIEAGAIENEKPYNVGGDLMTATVKDLWVI
jgi:lactoylglutathione lyase